MHHVFADVSQLMRSPSRPVDPLLRIGGTKRKTFRNLELPCARRTAAQISRKFLVAIDPPNFEKKFAKLWPRVTPIPGAALRAPVGPRSPASRRLPRSGLPACRFFMRRTGAPPATGLAEKGCLPAHQLTSGCVRVFVIGSFVYERELERNWPCS